MQGLRPILQRASVAEHAASSDAGQRGRLALAKGVDFDGEGDAYPPRHPLVSVEKVGVSRPSSPELHELQYSTISGSEKLLNGIQRSAPNPRGDGT